jgi:hypothetical protein
LELGILGKTLLCIAALLVVAVIPWKERKAEAVKDLGVSFNKAHFGSQARKRIRASILLQSAMEVKCGRSKQCCSIGSRAAMEWRWCRIKVSTLGAPRFVHQL